MKKLSLEEQEQKKMSILQDLSRKTDCNFDIFGGTWHYPRGLIGFLLNAKGGLIPVYYYSLIIEDLMDMGMDYEEAVDFFGYNVSCFGFLNMDENKPIIVSPFGDFVDAHYEDKNLIGEVEDSESREIGVYITDDDVIPLDQPSDRIYIRVFDFAKKMLMESVEENILV